MRAFATFEHRMWLGVIGLGLSLVTAPAALRAQSLTSGSLRGTVQTADGVPIGGASVTIESRGGQAIASLTTDRSGAFRTSLLVPGEFRVLVEQIGYQPLRTSGILVTAGNVTSLVISLERRPPASVEATAYFIVSEALTNVAKHAQASSAEVALGEVDGRLRVEISDDGRGGADPHGAGLRGLADRAAAIDGSFSVVSRPGEGTHIVTELPCAS